MKYRLKKKVLFEDGLIVATIIIVMFAVYSFMTSSPIHFIKGPYQVEINSKVDYSQFIESVDDASIKDVKIDAKDVDVKKLGEYTVKYQLGDAEKELSVRVVDTVAPKVEVKSMKVAKGQKLNAEDFVQEVKDETKTVASFKKNYQFNQLGEQTVVLVVEDEGKNKTEAEVKINVIEDKTAPTITGNHFSIVVGTEVDLKDYINVKDDCDPRPEIIIDQGNFDSSKKGEYSIKVTVKDFSGNKTEKTIIAKVLNKDEIKEKVVYLTFDDGPSKYTPEILEILDKYDAKATFFITGMNSSYRKYIEIANEKGHTIGLHTYSHKYNKVYSSTDAYFNDLNKIGQLAKEYIGYVPKYIRFPGGSSNTVSKKYSKGIMTKLTKMVEKQGYKYYDWNAENGDGFSKMSKQEMIKRGTSSKANQIMILMHDANAKKDTVETLPTIIEHYQKKGYVFKAIDDTSIVPHQRVNN